jgi:hypothetical protein
LGALAGLAWWAFGLTLVYSVPAAIVLFASDLRHSSPRTLAVRVGAAAAGIALGAAPMVLWSSTHGLDVLLQELFGSAIAGASPQGLLAAGASHLVNLILFGPTVVLGLRPPWSASPLGMPFTPVAAVLWLVAAAIGVRKSSWPQQDLAGRKLLIGVALAVTAGFVLTPLARILRSLLPSLAAPLAILPPPGCNSS